MPQTPEEDRFFSRWSRRKRDAEAEAQDQPEVTAEQQDAFGPVAEEPESESLSPEDLAALPSLDDLTASSDIRGFMQKGVPDALRNAALRKMWMLTPAIRDHVDPAVDYAWDWNTPGGVPGDGVGPSAERAAQMLRDLVDPRCAAEDEIALETDGITHADPVSEPPVSAMQNRAPSVTDEAVQGPFDDAAQRVAATDKTQEIQSTNESDAPRRRHGGALPT